MTRADDGRRCGRSPSTGPYTIEQSVADLHAVVRGTGPSPDAVLGHSWGGLLALRYALAPPEHVSHLVYVSGAGEHPAGRGPHEMGLIRHAAQ
ncbi:alpha/beta fold hydrolase [Catellatospora methionotrophica]